MAVVVQCSHCSNILELDDGFRGGVCRCSQCGSLLQVPKSSTRAARKARPATPGIAPTASPRSSNPKADPGLSRGQLDPRSRSGLTHAAEATSGSGAFARSPLRPLAPATVLVPATHPPGPPSPPLHSRSQIAAIKKTNRLLYAVVGTIVLLLLFAVLLLAHSWTSGTPAPRPQPTAGEASARGTPAKNATIPSATGPTFLSIPLVGKRIVFGVDSGSSAQDSFSYLQKGLSQAIATLAPDQEFVVAFWKDQGLRTLPATGWATRETFALLQKDLDNAAAFGSSDPVSAMKQCLELGGNQVILVTAKYDLTPDLAPQVLAARQIGQRIDAIKIASMISAADPQSPLERIAQQANGTFLLTDLNKLDALLHPRKEAN